MLLEKYVIAQNVSGALHLRDALHHESAPKIRIATHPNADAVQFYHYDFEQLQKYNLGGENAKNR